MPLKYVMQAWVWFMAQITGTWRNLKAVWARWQFDNFLPQAISGFIQELFDLIPNALGRGSAYRQISSSVALIIIAVLLTPFTLGWSIVLAVPWLITLVLGLWRLVPAVNDRFTRLRGNKLKDGDLRRWERD